MKVKKTTSKTKLKRWIMRRIRCAWLLKSFRKLIKLNGKFRYLIGRNVLVAK